MHCLMSSQSFGPKPRQGLHNRTLADRDLVLDYRMDRGVQSFPRKSNPLPPMVRLHGCNAFDFIHGEPGS